MSARLRETGSDVDAESFLYAESRLNEWGWQYGFGAEYNRAPDRRDPAIKEMMLVAKTWKARLDLQKERSARRRAAARNAAETRRLRREHRVTICSRCGHIHYRVCKRCAADPRVTARGKQTFAPAPLPTAFRHVTATAEEVERIVRKLPEALRDVLVLCYCDHQTPWRQHAWDMLISWHAFKRLREAGVEAVAERLAIGMDRALQSAAPVPIR